MGCTKGERRWKDLPPAISQQSGALSKVERMVKVFRKRNSQTFQSDDSNFQWALTQCDENILVFHCSPRGSQGSWLLRSWSMLNECKIKCQLNSSSQCVIELLFISASHLSNSVLFAFFFFFVSPENLGQPFSRYRLGRNVVRLRKKKKLSAAAPSGRKQAGKEQWVINSYVIKAQLVRLLFPNTSGSARLIFLHCRISLWLNRQTRWSTIDHRLYSNSVSTSKAHSQTSWTVLLNYL